MPEFDHDSDKIEQFFRKAASKPDVAFSEDDWKKLEARLDAADAARIAKTESPGKTVITATVVAALLLSSLGIWWGSKMDANTTNAARTTSSSPVTVEPRAESSPADNTPRITGDDQNPSVAQNKSAVREQTRPLLEDKSRHERLSTDQDFLADENIGNVERDNSKIMDNEAADAVVKNALSVDDKRRLDADGQVAVPLNEEMQSALPIPLREGKVRNELVRSSADFSERNKQRARIELPGAEEADETGRKTMVEEEHASDKEHVAKPRLSLLLSFAPDFSGTSLGQYSPPGKAFGGMIHYHLKNRWSISAGVIKNYKQYTGAGEDYTPPTGYWKYYTNGVIPETIDGSCSVLEFPIMVQYTVRDRGRNRWIVGAGASSYIMQTESYRYHFSQPNPGAKDGWDSRGSTRFMFNMLNLTIGYEHQVIPGLMVGLEPYLKVPLEDIGWSNLRLYSSGASITLRYTLLGRKQIVPAAFRSRGPD